MRGFLGRFFWAVAAVLTAAAVPAAEVCEPWETTRCFGVDWTMVTADDVDGMDVYLRNAAGRTPLHFAARDNADVAVVRALLENGAEVDAADVNGGTPLHWAVYKNKNAEVVRALLESGADVNAPNAFGQTPLHRAVYAVSERWENIAVIKLLLEYGANVRLADDSGQVPFDIIKYHPGLENLEVYILLRDIEYV